MKWKTFDSVVIYFGFVYFLHLTRALHPMLYFNENDVAKLRHKSKTTHVKITKIIEEAGRSLKDDPKTYLPPESHKTFASRWNEIYGNNLCIFSMYCVLYPNDETAIKLVIADFWSSKIIACYLIAVVY